MAPRKNQDTRKLAHAFSDDFLGRYEILDVLGAGGTAVVYRATQLSLKRPVALKVLDAVGFEATDALARFEEEAKIAARLEHPNLVQLYEFGRDRDLAYMVYEYVEGSDLDRKIREAPSGARKGLLVEDALEILADVARGVAYAHKMGVVHRDMKPANVLLEADGMAKVADFGLARTRGEARAIQTKTGVVVGTPECMSPEQARGKEAGPATDVYALGVMFYWMLSGRPPFSGENAAEVMKMHVRGEPVPVQTLRPNLPPGIYELLDQMLRKDPRERPEAKDVERAARVAGGHGPKARSQVRKALRTRPAKITKTVARRGPHPAVLAGGVLGVLALGGWLLVPAPRPADVVAAIGPDRARFTWGATAAVLEIRPADASSDWRPVEGHRVGDRWEAEVGDLLAKEEYAWRLVAGGEPTPERTFRPPRAVTLVGPWPRYDPTGRALGWWIRAEGGATVRLADGAEHPANAGLLEAPPGVYSFVYGEGMVEVGGTLADPPSYDRAVAAALMAVGDLDPRTVLAAGIQRRDGAEPTAACRAAAEDAWRRLEGVRAGLPRHLERLGPAERLRARARLGAAETVDRALVAEGFEPAFGVEGFLAACLAVEVEADRGLALTEGIELVTAEERAQFSFHASKIPPRIEVPPGRGDLEVALVLADLNATLRVELEVGENRVAVRPPLEDWTFHGRIRVPLPAAWVRGVDSLRLHVEREDLPGREGTFQLPRYPLFEPDPEKRTHQFRGYARVVSHAASRR